MDKSNINSITPVAFNELPSGMRNSISSTQKENLAFGKKIFKVIGTPRIQSFQIGSHGKGQMLSGGAGTTLGDWGIFGGISSIQMATINQFRTDVQLRLEDNAGDKTFLEVKLPFSATFSIEAGDMLTMFYVKGGMREPEDDDFKFDDWTPFVAENKETKQIIPIGTLPYLRQPSGVATGFLYALIVIFAFAFASNLQSLIPFLIAAAIITPVAIYNERKGKRRIAVARAAVDDVKIPEKIESVA